MINAKCPLCQSEVSVGWSPAYDQRVTCSSCNAVLEIVWLDPIEFDWLDNEEEESEDK